MSLRGKAERPFASVSPHVPPSLSCTVGKGAGRPPGADDMIPLLIYVTAHSAPSQVGLPCILLTFHLLASRAAAPSRFSLCSLDSPRPSLPFLSFFVAAGVQHAVHIPLPLGREAQLGERLLFHPPGVSSHVHRGEGTTVNQLPSCRFGRGPRPRLPPLLSFAFFSSSPPCLLHQSATPTSLTGIDPGLFLALTSPLPPPPFQGSLLLYHC